MRSTFQWDSLSFLSINSYHCKECAGTLWMGNFDSITFFEVCGSIYFEVNLLAIGVLIWIYFLLILRGNKFAVSIPLPVNKTN